MKIPASKCTSRPDCACDFCTGLRLKAFCYRRDRYSASAGNQACHSARNKFWVLLNASGCRFREECHARNVQPGKYRDCLYSASRSVTVAAFQASKECSGWTNAGGP